MASATRIALVVSFITLLSVALTSAGPSHRNSVNDVEIDPNYQCVSNGTFPHSDCWKFYNCGIDTPAYVMQCPYPLLYELEKNWCWYPEEVDCGGRVPRPEEVPASA